MRAALVIGNRMDFVHDHRLHPLKMFAAAARCQQNVERFRRSDQDVRRIAQHRRAFPRQGVPGSYCSSDLLRTGIRGREPVAESHGEVLRDSSEYRWTALSVATRRPPASPRRASRRAPGGRAGRCRPGMPPAFCPIPLELKSALACRRECWASRGSAAP